MQLFDQLLRVYLRFVSFRFQVMSIVPWMCRHRRLWACLRGWLRPARAVRRTEANPGLPQVVQKLMFGMEYETDQAHLRLCLVSTMQPV